MLRSFMGSAARRGFVRRDAGWAFTFEPLNGTVARIVDRFDPAFNGTYADAKKAARAFAQSTFTDASLVTITVCS